MKKYYIENMPQVNESMERVEAWYDGKIMDRVPIRFSEHNGRHNVDLKQIISKYESIKDFWFDAEQQVKLFLDNLEGQKVYGDTFPVFYPNLGPSVFASFYGVPLKYAEVTSWAEHIIDDFSAFDVDSLFLNAQCENWKKIDEITNVALNLSKDRFFVGYTDLHPSLDCVADFTGVENLCMAMYEEPDKVRRFTEKLCDDFFPVYEYYYKMLEDMPSVTWMGIPFRGKMHIPSCDFSSMLSENMFEEFALPYIEKEAKAFDYNIFHLDGPGVVRHIDKILEIDEIRAIQLVQGVGDDEPIMQWIPLINKIVEKGKGVVVGLKENELKEFAKNIKPKGLYITMAAQYENQPDIVRFIENWK